MKVEGYQPEISGFHAKRFEFDHEYDNDAELLVSEIEFLPTDTPVSSLQILEALHKEGWVVHSLVGTLEKLSGELSGTAVTKALCLKEVD